MSPDRARRQIAEAEAFIRGVTTLLGVFPIGYAILTFCFGDPLWAGAPTYDTANSVPHAPESWGVVAVCAGVLILVGEYTRHHRLIVAGAGVQSVWCLFFSVAFLTDSLDKHISFGLPGTWVYFIFAALLVARARLAWVWRG